MLRRRRRGAGDHSSNILAVNLTAVATVLEMLITITSCSSDVVQPSADTSAMSRDATTTSPVVPAVGLGSAATTPAPLASPSPPASGPDAATVAAVWR